MLPYPRFSDAEMERRRAALDAAMAANGVSHLLLNGANRTGSAIGWLTRWPVTREALVVHSPGQPDVLLVNFYNHVPNAQRIATESDVRWAGESPFETAIEELRRRHAAVADLATVGTLDPRAHSVLTAAFGEPVDMTRDYTRLRLVKSREELDWLRIAAAMTDRALEALQHAARAGASELELADVVERAYVAEGGTTHIHYIGSTSMRDPDLCVPRQYPAARRLEAGDVVICELSASYWDYTGQILRTIAVNAEPTSLYRELHDTAEEAFAAIAGRLRAGVTARELMEASAVIEEAGFTIRDDLNVVTRDETAGVQTGELLVVTETGAKRLHGSERGFLRSAAGSDYSSAPT